jgi:hypothetical protein
MVGRIDRQDRAGIRLGGEFRRGGTSPLRLQDDRRIDAGASALLR